MKTEEFKDEIEKLFDKYRKSWYNTLTPKIAILRFELSRHIFGNDGIFEILDKLEKLKLGELKNEN